MAHNDGDGDELHADLRALVEEGTAPDSDTALDEVLRRGRGKRRQRRLSAIAGVAAVVAGIGVTTTILPTLGTATPQLQPASGNPGNPRHERTDAGSEPRNPSRHTSRDPESVPSSQRESMEAPSTLSAAPPQVACPSTSLHEFMGPAYQIPRGLTVCVDRDPEQVNLLRVIREALPQTVVSLKGLTTGGAESIVRVTGDTFTSLVLLNERRYFGSLARARDSGSPGEPLIVRLDQANTRSNIERSVSVPVAMIYFPDGRLYLVRVDPPDPMPAELLDKIVRELATIRG